MDSIDTADTFSEGGVQADFRLFVLKAEPQLRRALIGAIGIDATQDAVAEALLYAWQNWSRAQAGNNTHLRIWAGLHGASRRRVGHDRHSSH